MATLAQMRTNIADYLNRSDLNTQINLAINRAIKFYYRNYRFWFNETTATFNTVASQAAYGTADGAPSDMLKRDLVQITINANQIIELTPRTYKWVQDRNISNVVGTPTDYAYYQSKFYLYTPPDAVYVVTVSYVKSYSELTVDSDSNDFTNNAEDLIESRACWWIYNKILHNKDLAEEAKSDENDALNALVKQTQRLIGTGRLTPTTF